MGALHQDKLADWPAVVIELQASSHYTDSAHTKNHTLLFIQNIFESEWYLG
jgi:hypothetical protein